MRYGIPYMGSKSKIAEDIISFLPSGKRFVDLFGGGFAMSHCALLSNKYEKVLYNEINPLLPELIQRAIKGGISWDWVSREDFYKRKDTDGLVKYIWSFGNDGNNYMFSKDAEPIKKMGHEFCLYGKPIKGVDIVMPMSLIPYTVHDRRIALLRSICGLKYRTQQLEQLERVQQLERLEQLEIRCSSYDSYKYEDGDVVYCDPPYEGVQGYNGKAFDHDKFFNWVASRPYRVYFSHYPLSDDRQFEKVWSIGKRQTMAGGCGALMEECIYINR